MNSTEAIAALIGIAVSIGLVLGLLWFIPSCLRSLFRYRLWRLRDSLFDEVTAGILPNEPVVSDLIKRIEDVIRLSRHVTLYKFVVTGVITSWDMREARADAKAYEDAKKKALSPECRHHLERYERQLGKEMVIHLLRGSPSGWIGTIILGLYFTFSSVRAGDKHLIKSAKKRSVRMGRQLSSEEKINRLRGEAKPDPDEPMSAYAN